MGMVYKLPLTPQQIWNKKTYDRVLELWKMAMIGTSADVAAIVNGSYFPVGGNGEGELNGVPTAADIENIIAETYTHHEVETDEYGFKADEIPSESVIDAIIAGTYVPQSATDNSAFEGNVSADDIERIIGG